jgi:WD40 repeat protein
VLWDASTGRELQQLIGHTGALNCVAISADDKTLFTVGENKTVRLWSAGNGTEMRRLEVKPTVPRACAWSPDGSLIVIGGDGDIRAYDGSSGAPRRVLARDKQCASLAFSSDGMMLAGLTGQWAVVWNAMTGAKMSRFPGFTNCKPQYRKSDGLFPFLRLHSHSGQQSPMAEAFEQEITTLYEAREQEH